MHTLIRCALLLFCITLASAAVDVRRPIPEILLRDGSRITNVEIVSYAPTAVMARWDQGRGTINYDDLPAEVRSAVAPFIPKPAVPKQPATRTIPKARTITGQVFSITRGAGSYKYGGENIYAYPASEYKKAVEAQKRAFTVSGSETRAGREIEMSLAWMEATKKLKAVAHTATDADGKFELKLPEGDFFIFCSATREVVGSSECSVWAVPAPDETGKLDLNSRNEWVQP